MGGLLIVHFISYSLLRIEWDALYCSPSRPFRPAAVTLECSVGYMPSNAYIRRVVISIARILGVVPCDSPSATLPLGLDTSYEYSYYVVDHRVSRHR